MRLQGAPEAMSEQVNKPMEKLQADITEHDGTASPAHERWRIEGDETTHQSLEIRHQIKESIVNTFFSLTGCLWWGSHAKIDCNEAGCLRARFF